MDVLPAPIRPTSAILRPAIESGIGIVSRNAVLRVIIWDVSTPAAKQAIAPRVESPGFWLKARSRCAISGKPPPGASMIRIFLFVVLAGLVALAGGVLVLGLFPPTPQPHAVEKVVPNEKFTAH